MKDAIIGVVLTAALIALFSAYAPILPTQTVYGVYPTEPGEGEITLPGDGDGAAEMMAEAKRHSIQEQEEQRSTENEAAKSEESGKRQQEEQSMNEIIIAFWHGVAAVLIGEACALAVAAAFIKLKKGSKDCGAD